MSLGSVTVLAFVCIAQLRRLPFSSSAPAHSIFVLSLVFSLESLAFSGQSVFWCSEQVLKCSEQCSKFALTCGLRLLSSRSAPANSVLEFSLVFTKTHILPHALFVPTQIHTRSNTHARYQQRIVGWQAAYFSTATLCNTLQCSLSLSLSLSLSRFLALSLSRSHTHTNTHARHQQQIVSSLFFGGK